MVWLAEAERTLGVTDHLEANLSSLGQFTLQQDAARNLRILTQYDKRDEKVGRKGRGGQRSYNNVSDRRARTKAVNVAIVMVGLSDSEGC